MVHQSRTIASILAKQQPILLLGLTLAFAGLLLVLWKSQRMIEEVNSLRWPSTTGIIENSIFYISTKGKHATHFGELTYLYTVNNREYLGTRYDAKGNMQTGRKEKAAEVASAMEKGAHVEVFYDLDDPSKSLLKNGISEDSWVRITFSSFLLLIGVNTTLKEWKRIKDHSLGGRKARPRIKSK